MAISYIQDGNDSYNGGLSSIFSKNKPLTQATQPIGTPQATATSGMGQYKFSDLQNKLGYDIMNPMYSQLTGKTDNPFFMANEEGGPGTYWSADQASKLGWDPSVFDDYTFDWADGGYGNTGSLTAFKDGKQVGNWAQKDQSTMSTLLEGGALAAAAFGGLGLAGAGPWSGLSNMFGPVPDVAVGFDGAMGAGAAEAGAGAASAGAGGSAAGLSGLDAAMLDMGAGLSGGVGGSVVGAGEALALGGAGATNAALAESAAGLPGYGLSSASPVGAVSQSSGAMNGILNTIGQYAPNTASALGNLGKNTVGSLVSNTLTGGGNGQQGMNSGNIISGLAQLYQQNQYQNAIKDLYGTLSSQFGPDSAYAKQMRQQLDRRDAAAGRRSQYGPREVELQAKLAAQQSQQATTLAGLLKDSNSAMGGMLSAGIGLGNETGLNNIIGGAASGVGQGIWADLQNSDWWNDLFGGD